MPDQAVMDLAPDLRIVWDDVDSIRGSLTSDTPSARWRLEGELGAGHAAVRALTGVTAKGALLLLAGARPSDADGHAAENPQAVIISRSGEVEVIGEALFSTQYAANGAVERIGLELYAEGDDYPVRGAGDATRTSASEEGAGRREQALLEFRLDGEQGIAILDTLYA